MALASKFQHSFPPSVHGYDDPFATFGAAMKRLAASIILVLMTATFAADPPAPTPKIAITPTKPSLTDAEKQAGWKLLFDGVSTTGWRGLGMDEFPTDCWEVRDGCLHCLGGK